METLVNVIVGSSSGFDVVVLVRLVLFCYAIDCIGTLAYVLMHSLEQK